MYLSRKMGIKTSALPSSEVIKRPWMGIMNVKVSTCEASTHMEHGHIHEGRGWVHLFSQNPLSTHPALVDNHLTWKVTHTCRLNVPKLIRKGRILTYEKWQLFTGWWDLLNIDYLRQKCSPCKVYISIFQQISLDLWLFTQHWEGYRDTAEHRMI